MTGTRWIKIRINYKVMLWTVRECVLIQCFGIDRHAITDLELLCVVDIKSRYLIVECFIYNITRVHQTLSMHITGHYKNKYEIQ